MIKFDVPNPCHENWDRMQLQENGRYCGSCQKVVIDFTSKTEKEIIDFISANAGKKMCGTFKNSQLNKLPQESQKQENMIRFLAAILLAFGMSLFSCQSVDLGDKPPLEPAPLEKPLFTTGVIINTNFQKDCNNAYPPIVIEDTTSSISDSVGNDFVTRVEVMPVQSKIEKIKDSINNVTLITGMMQASMPEFPGGETEMKKYIIDNLIYPEKALENGVTGTVYVSFKVKENGEIDNVSLLRGIGFDCDQEAIRVIENMPKWNPVVKFGKPVEVQISLPIKFGMK